MTFREKLSLLGFSDYQAYLAAPHWKTIRAKWIRKRCFCCDAKKSLQLHHRTYARLGKELQADLVTVCRECHEEIHARVKLDIEHLETAHFGVKKTREPAYQIPSKCQKFNERKSGKKKGKRKPKAKKQVKIRRCGGVTCRNERRKGQQYCEACRIAAKVLAQQAVPKKKLVPPFEPVLKGIECQTPSCKNQVKKDAAHCVTCKVARRSCNGLNVEQAHYNAAAKILSSLIDGYRKMFPSPVQQKAEVVGNTMNLASFMRKNRSMQLKKGATDASISGR